MRAVVTLEEVDIKATEEFLMAQDDITDASVWFDDGELRAHVTLAEDAHWDDSALREACATTIGPRHVPRDFVLLRHRNRRG